MQRSTSILINSLYFGSFIQKNCGHHGVTITGCFMQWSESIHVFNRIYFKSRVQQLVDHCGVPTTNCIVQRILGGGYFSDRETRKIGRWTASWFLFFMWPRSKKVQKSWLPPWRCIGTWRIWWDADGGGRAFICFFLIGFIFLCIRHSEQSQKL